MSDGLFTQDDVIYTYTRAQALEDGVLVDVTKEAAGIFRYPVALTARLAAEVDSPEKRRALLTAAFVAIKRNPGGGDSLFFPVFLHGKKQELLLVVGPGDNWEPVVTIGFPMDF